LPRRLTALVIATLALPGVAACGGDDESEAFNEDFPALSQRIVTLGEEVGNAIETAGETTDQQLAEEFDGFARDLGALRRELERLEPPEEVADERDDLVEAMGEVRASLEEIADAAVESDPAAARAATLELVDRSAELREAREVLVGAVREAE
jgi:predicted  nucleic acid-binding Zn-ribbon protein